MMALGYVGYIDAWYINQHLAILGHMLINIPATYGVFGLHVV